MAQSLLTANYFPCQRKSADELPPLWSSKDFTLAVVDQIPGSPNSNPKPGYDSLELGQTRADGQLRITSIPHPSAYARLVKLIHDNWAQLEHVAHNKNSRIRPRSHPDGRLVVMNYGEWKSRTLGHIQESFGSRVVVRADVANFFGSLYTHSVPWALVGRKTAKSTIGKSHWYNDLDDALQFCKRRETNGIAVGPATSNIFAELILGEVDKELKPYLFHRYIDDYTAFCTSIGEARRFVRDLEKGLAKFKLTLNHSKTRFSDLPCSVSPDWVLQIRRKARILPEPVRPGEAVDFIDFALLLCEQSCDPNAMKYAFRALAAKKRHYWTDSAVTEYGLLLWSKFPALFPALLPFILNAANRSGRLILQEKLLAVLDDSLRRDRSDLACWSMYYIDLIGGSLPDDSIKAAVESLDSCRS